MSGNQTRFLWAVDLDPDTVNPDTAYTTLSYFSPARSPDDFLRPPDTWPIVKARATWHAGCHDPESGASVSFSTSAPRGEVRAWAVIQDEAGRVDGFALDPPTPGRDVLAAYRWMQQHAPPDDAPIPLDDPDALDAWAKQPRAHRLDPAIEAAAEGRLDEAREAADEAMRRATADGPPEQSLWWAVHYAQTEGVGPASAIHARRWAVWAASQIIGARPNHAEAAGFTVMLGSLATSPTLAQAVWRAVASAKEPLTYKGEKIADWLTGTIDHATAQRPFPPPPFPKL